MYREAVSFGGGFDSQLAGEDVQWRRFWRGGPEVSAVISAAEDVLCAAAGWQHLLPGGDMGACQGRDHFYDQHVDVKDG